MKLGVFGGDLSQSSSEELHVHFGRVLGVEIDFQKIEVSAENFDQALRYFFLGGGIGASVTAPLKERVVGLLDETHGLAREVASVNCVHNSDGRLTGYNTDGPGIISALQNYHDIEVRGKRVVILGSGGVAIGIIGALQESGANEITVWGRDIASVQNIVHTFGTTNEITGAYDLIVHATSASSAFDLSWLENSIRPTTFVYDVQYLQSGESTWFCGWAKSKNLACANGLSMLIEQGALAFEIWGGVSPDLSIRKRMFTSMQRSTGKDVE